MSVCSSQCSQRTTHPDGYQKMLLRGQGSQGSTSHKETIPLNSHLGRWGHAHHQDVSSRGEQEVIWQWLCRTLPAFITPLTWAHAGAAKARATQPLQQHPAPHRGLTRETGATTTSRVRVSTQRALEIRKRLNIEHEEHWSKGEMADAGLKGNRGQGKTNLLNLS